MSATRSRLGLWIFFVLFALPLLSQPETDCTTDDLPPAGGEVIVTFGTTTNSFSFNRRSDILVGQAVTGKAIARTVRSDYGFYSRFLLPPRAPYLTATQGEYPDRIQLTWVEDLLSTQSSRGFIIKRDGAFLAEVDATTRQFIDFNVQAGERYVYSITGRNSFGNGVPGSDVGFINPNGVVTGQITTRSGNPVVGAYVTLEPTVGKSLRFDGVDDYVCISHDSTINTPQFTVSTWVKIDNAAEPGMLLDLGRDLNKNFWLSTTGGGTKGITAGIGDGTTTNEISFNFLDNTPEDGDLDNPNAWHHVAAVYDGSTLILYVDGLFRGSVVGTMTTEAALLTMGTSRNNDNYFSGRLDDVRIYNYPLTQTDILLGKDVAASANTPGILAYWKFDEGIGEKIFDIGGRDIDGHLENGAAFNSDAARVMNAGITDEGGFYTIEGVNYSDAPTVTARPRKDFYAHQSLELNAAKNGWAQLPSFDLPDTATLEIAVQPFEINSHQVLIEQPGVLSFFIRGGSYFLNAGGVEVDVAAATTKMQHLALRMNAGAGTTDFYLNGALVTTLAAAHSTGTSANPWHLGGRNGTLSLTGLIDEFTVFDSLVSEAALQIHASPLTGEGVTSGIDAGDPKLVAFFPLDEGEGTELQDYGPNMLESGTLFNADWSILAYRQEVTPHLFRPSSRVVNLNGSVTAVGDIDFTDESTVTISGVVRFSNTFCYQDSVQMLINGRTAIPPVFADENGRWVADLEPGTNVIVTPDYGDTTQRYSPPFFEVRKISRPVAGVLFQNTTKRTVMGQVAGGQCRLSVNPAGSDLRVTVSSLNGCWSETQKISDPDGKYSFTTIPPIPVRVAVTKHNDPNIFSAFDIQGGETTDLRTKKRDTIDFVYTSLPNVEIEPFQVIETGACSQAYIQSSVDQYVKNRYTTRIKVFENYAGGRCFLQDSFELRVSNEVADAAPFDTIVRDTNVFTYTYPAGLPNFTGDRKKKIEVRATTATGSATGLEEVVVLGRRSREATFTTTSPSWPLFVLRDPPGDGSFATLAEGTEHCTVVLGGNLETVTGSVITEVDASPEVTTSIGFGVTVETTIEAGVDTRTLVSASVTEESDYKRTICSKVLTTVSTSSGEDLIFGDADVYAGMAANINIGTDDVLFLDPTTCTFRDTARNRFDIDSYETDFYYSEWQLKTDIIPTLEASPFRRDSLAALEWREFIAENQRDKEQARFERNLSFDGLVSITREQENTFAFEHSHKVVIEANSDFTAATGIEVNDAGGTVSLVVNLKGAGTIGGGGTEGSSTKTTYTLADGEPGDNYSIDVKQGGRWNTPVFDLIAGESMCPWEPGTRNREQVGFNIDRTTVINVPENAPAVFKLTLGNEGQTGTDAVLYNIGLVENSNPDGAILRIDGQPILNPITRQLQPGENLELTLTVNKGPTEFNYDSIGVFMASKCMYDHARNLGYDLSKIRNGTDPETGEPITREGPYAREDLAKFYKEFRLTVEFIEPCTPIEINFPMQDWVVTPDDDNLLGITMSEYNNQDPDLDTVRVQYRPVGGNGSWINIVELPRESFADHPISRTVTWNMEELRDGQYEIRATANCSDLALAPGISTVIQGRKETRPPALLGTPEPADGVLSPGDEISITFTKPIDCGRIFQADGIGTNININNLALIDQTTGELIDATISCSGDKIIIVPNIANRFIENRFLKVVTQGILDFYGNQSERIEWEFFVNRSNLFWFGGRIDETVLEGNSLTITRQIRNQSGQITSYTIPSVPNWMQVFPRAGSLAPGERQTVTFEFPADLLADAYATDLIMETVDGEEPLRVDLRVTCEGPQWNIDPANFSFSSNLTVELDIEGVLSDDRVDRIGAFVNGELRGVANIARYDEISSSDLINPNLAFLTVYSNRASGDTIDFQIWDASACLLYGKTIERFPFVSDGIIGQPLLPQTIHTTGELLKKIYFNPGWNWFSYNVELPNNSVNATMRSLSGAGAGATLKGQGAFSQYTPGPNQWFGNLTSTNVKPMYQFKSLVRDSLTLIGSAVDIDQPIAVNTGWNWIGFLPNRGLPVTTALQSLVPLNGDVVKSQLAFAQYVAGIGWVGNLRFMSSPNGYLLRMSNAGVLRYPDIATINPPGLTAPEETLVNAAGKLTHEVTANLKSLDSLEARWTVDPTRYELSMNMVAVVLEGENNPLLDDGDEIAAFVGDELRGADRVIHIPQLGRYYAFLTVFANQPGETVTYRLYDRSEDTVTSLTETTEFVSNQVIGLVTEPYVFNLGTTSINGVRLNLADKFFVYPNPATAKAYISFEAVAGEAFTITIRDIVGRQVNQVKAVTRSRETVMEWDTGDVPNGIYLITLKREGSQQTTKIQVQR